MLRIKDIFTLYRLGKNLHYNDYSLQAKTFNKNESEKQPKRSDVINFLLQFLNRDTLYMEIGVRNPSDNFQKICATTKYSIDPGIEYKKNPVDFKMTSDEFYFKLKSGELLHQDIRFDVIFIDGLHLAEQVNRDIENSLQFLKDDGFIVLHDCNPPTEWHARESFRYNLSPAGGIWNGTTWKAFLKYRYKSDVHTCCIDSDWGIGIISKKYNFGPKPNSNNSFFEFLILETNRKDQLNLIEFSQFKELLNN